MLATPPSAYTAAAVEGAQPTLNTAVPIIMMRDGAALIILASEGGGSRATITGAIERVGRAWSRLTPDAGECVDGAGRRAWARKDRVSLDAAGETLRAQPALPPSHLRYAAADCQYREGRCRCDSQRRAAVRAGRRRGFKIERLYFTLDGKPADPTKAKQNDRFAVVLRITEPQPLFGRVIVQRSPPADRDRQPRLVSSGDAALSWMARCRPTRSSAMTASAPLNRSTKDPAVFAAYGMGGFRPLRSPPSVCRGHVPAGLWLHWHWRGRGDGRAMSDEHTNSVTGGRKPASPSPNFGRGWILSAASAGPE
jgi:hypothetical protein